MIESGTIVAGKYRIIEKLGQGGMSTVFLAEDIKLNKKWTVKEIKKRGEVAFDKANLRSLIDEANLIKKFDHPDIPRIVDIIDTADTVFIVRDYIDGEPMDQILKNYGSQPESSVVEWSKKICETLLYLHKRTPKVIYRDMKPANLMLVSDGSLKLIDFGIAYEGDSCNKPCAGTKGYAPPEQFNRERVTDERSDIYSLGITMYQMATNINPCADNFDKSVLVSDINPKYSKQFSKIIDKCIQTNPEDRYQNCSELLYSLNKLATEKNQPQKKSVGAILLPYLFVMLGTFCLFMIFSGESMFPALKGMFEYSSIIFKVACFVLSCVFYTLYGVFLKKKHPKEAPTTLEGDTKQFVVPTVPPGSLFDTIKNTKEDTTVSAFSSKKVMADNYSFIDNSKGFAAFDEESGTQLLGYAPNVQPAAEPKEDEFETGGTQLLGYAPNVQPAAEPEEDEFETGGTQLLGYAPNVQPATEPEEDEFETGGTQLLGYAPNVQPAAEPEEDEFETGGTQLLGYAPNVQLVAEPEENKFGTGDTLLSFRHEKEKNAFDGETKKCEHVQDAKHNEKIVESQDLFVFEMIKREIVLASTDIVIG